VADFGDLSASVESIAEALGGQLPEFYERDLPQIAADETAKRVQADVVVVLLDNGGGQMEVTGGVGLSATERRLQVEYDRAVMRELFRAGVGLIEQTERVRGALVGIPGSRAETLAMVPLTHHGLAFGALLAGRRRPDPDAPSPTFSHREVEALLNFASAATPSLRTAALLRHLKAQLKDTPPE
jgi:hypothetical protein